MGADPIHHANPMQLQVPDPRFTRSAHARTNFQLAWKLALGFVIVLWLVHVAGWMLGLELQRFGVRPRQVDGLTGIAFAPLLHGDFAHLVSNSLPLLVLGTGILYLYPGASLRVLSVLYLGSGLLVWLFARSAVHIGASGLVYGLVSYIFVAGIARRDARAIAASLLVYFLYGTLAWGVLPGPPGVSWETHLAAAAIGVVLAIRYRALDAVPVRRYSWEDEDSGL